MLLLAFVCAPAHAISRDEVLARAEAWLADGPLYSWDAWYTETVSGECCYRTDCSGFVSVLWGLPAPGHTTYSFAGGVWDDGVSYVIDPSELLPGDALNEPGDPSAGTGHIMLYVSGDFASGYVEVYHSYATGQPAAHEWVYINPSEWVPIRYVGIEDCEAEACDLIDNDCDGQVNEDYVCEIAAEPAVDASRHDTGTHTDVDGDGLADVCGRNADGFRCARAATGAETAVLAYFSDANGFNDVANSATVRTADVNGDGRADACGRQDAEGFRCFLSDGSAFGTVVDGPDWTDANGWADLSNYATIRMADINGDGMDDVCGRGDITFDCYLSDGAALQASTYSVALPDAYGMNQAMYYDTIRLADINADALKDLCIRGPAGFACYLNDGMNFTTKVDGPGLADGYGWGQVQYYTTLDMPDINADERADICIRGPDRVYCWASTGAGFGDTIEGPGLSDGYGWSLEPYRSTMRWADVDGDGRDDLCARGVDDVYCWRSTGTGFDEGFVGPTLSDANGWLDHANYATLALADRTGDGRADLCARGDAGVVCYESTGSSFGAATAGPAWGDAQGWATFEAYDTIAFAGGHEVQEDDTAGGGDSAGGDDSAGDDPARRSPRLPDGIATCGCAAGPTDPKGWFGVTLLGVLAWVRRRTRRSFET
jgi:MYXO-CTERM domain-containing protein